MSARDKDSAAKKRYLEALKDALIDNDACRITGIARKKVEAWRRCDSQFRSDLEMVELGIDDQVKKLALQKMGIITWDGNREICKLIPDGLINAWLKRKQPTDKITINTAQPLEIKGLSQEILNKLAEPEARPVENQVDIIGIPKKDLIPKATEANETIQ